MGQEGGRNRYICLSPTSRLFPFADVPSSAGLPKAQYAVGYFTEMGIGCRRDPLEANVWYVRAADSGDERAKHRLAAIRAAASGGGAVPAARMASPGRGKKVGKEEDGEKKGRKWGIF